LKYYLIAGEASGDLHASRLMQSIQRIDNQAEFRFFGGDLMSSVGGVCVKHYRELAYMGVTQVVLHIGTIFSNMKLCQNDILQLQPDCVILVDYPGFNLRMAKFIKNKTSIRVYYYISPKLWAWKEFRIKSIKRYVDELFSILPFEVPFYEQKHHYPIHYVGNPTVEEVSLFRQSYHETFDEFCKINSLSSKPIIAVLAGSRKQEIGNNLSKMIAAAEQFADYQIVIAGAPGISTDYYHDYVKGHQVEIVFDKTYPLLCHSTVALVTSGTATLETALFGVPQVVCYYIPFGRLMRVLRKLFLHIKFVSLVNLIADDEIVKELICDKMNVENCVCELMKIMPASKGRDCMLRGYDIVNQRLGEQIAPDNAATLMYKGLTDKD
jgi:lipid-A-disaccharide synthase